MKDNGIPATDEGLERIFMDDIRSRMASIAQCIFRLDELTEQGGDADHNLIKTLMREFHTVKACADFDGVNTLARVAHNVEDLLALFLRSETPPSRAHLDLLYTVVDFTLQIIGDFDIPEDDMARDAEALIAATQAQVTELRQLIEARQSGESIPAPDAASFLSRRQDDLDAAAAELQAGHPLLELTARLGQLRDLLLQMDARFSNMPALAAQAASVLGNIMEEKSLPLGNRLRHLMGTLLIALNTAARESRRPDGCDLGILADVVTVIRNCFADLIRGGRGELPGLDALIEMVEDIRWQLRVNLPGLPVFAPGQEKKIPLQTLSQHVIKLTQKAAAELGKEVRISTEVEPARTLGQSLMSQLDMILVHLLRNALDHGLETPGEREAAGKNRAGHIEFRAHVADHLLVISVTDDGRGLQRQKIIDKALASGLLKSRDAAEKADLGALIADPGFSTVAAPTIYSGRGMGMSIVKDHVEALGGRLEIQSEEGRGTSFILSIPLPEPPPAEGSKP